MSRNLSPVFSSIRGRGRRKGAALPGAFNMITGPSRSADIGQILILGAHGPRRLHVLIVGRV